LRNLKRNNKIVVKIWLFCASLFYIYTASQGVFAPRIMRSIHMAFFLPMAFIMFPRTKKSPENIIPLVDFLLAGLSLIVTLYITLNFERLEFRLESISHISLIEIIFGTIAFILVIEATRRAVCPGLAVVAIVAAAYFVLSPYLPGFLEGPDISYARIIENFYLYRDQGIFGDITGICATVIAIFIIFGAFIKNTGVGDLFIELATKVAGGSRGGPAKVAIISSGFFGSISGSAVANVFLLYP